MFVRIFCGNIESSYSTERVHLHLIEGVAL